MKVLVTGGAGYIGSHCCKYLAKSGHEPIVFDDFSLGRREFAKWGPSVEGNILNRDDIEKAISEHRPEAVMHFAALSNVGESVSRPAIYYNTNISGTLNLLSAMRENRIRDIVFSSTCAIYGEVGANPITEHLPCNPVNPYGQSKLACERIMDDFDNAYGIKSVRLRYFNAAGADPDSEIGEDREFESHLIPIAMDAAAGKRDSIKVFGTDYDTPDGTAIRDYVHVWDIAYAHLKGLEFLAEKNKSDFFNLGVGKGYSVSDVLNVVEKVSGKFFKRIPESRREGDPQSLVAVPDKANEILGWVPQHSNLENIVEDAWKWHCNRFQ